MPTFRINGKSMRRDLDQITSMYSQDFEAFGYQVPENFENATLMYKEIGLGLPATVATA